MSKRYTPPPDPIYRVGKKKEWTTMAIKYVERIETLRDNPDIIKALTVLKNYRKSLDIL